MSSYYSDDGSKESIILTFIGVLLFGLCVVVPMFFRFPLAGEHKGYVTAVDSGMFCTDVYFKTDLSSSQEDKYSINNGSQVINDLKKARDNKENITIEYSNNVIGYCHENISNVKR